MKKTLFAMAAATLWLCGMSVANAQVAKPLVTVAFSGYDQLKTDLAMVGELGGQPQLADGMEGLLTMMTQGRGLTGLDKSKPWGLVLQTKGEAFPVYGFIPVTKVEDVFTTLTQFGVKVDERGDGVHEVSPPNGPPMTVKVQGTWAFLAQDAGMLSDLPTDPIDLLGGLNKEYNVAIKASIANVPDQYKQMFIGLLQMNMQAANRRLPEESDEQYAMRLNATRMSMQQFTALVNDLEEITVGLSIDATKTAHLDVQVVARPDSPTAKKLNAAKSTTTQFAGFDQPGAAITLQQAGIIAESDLAQVKAILKSSRVSALASVKEQNLGDEEHAVAQQVINDLFDVLDKTVDGRKFDGGATVMIGTDAITLAAGGTVVDAAKLETILKQLVAEAAKSDPDVAKLVKFDVANHGGIKFHEITLPVPPADEPAGQKLVEKLGSPVTLTLGIGKDTLLVALGKDGMGLLTKIIDKSKAEAGKSVEPMQMVVHVEPIARLVADLAADDPDAQRVASMIAENLAGKSDKDTLKITQTAVPNGARVRIEVGEAILGLAPKFIGPGGAPMPGPAPAGSM